MDNQQEGAEYIFQEKFHNNADITAAVTQDLPDVQGAPGQYVVVARSGSMRQAGGALVWNCGYLFWLLRKVIGVKLILQ